MKYYHGSPNKFEIFDYNKIRTNGSSEGLGFYFTDNIDIAKGYGSDGYLYCVKLKGKKPLSDNEKTITKDDLKMYIEELHMFTNFLDNYGEIEYSGYDYVLNLALDSEYNYNDTDTEIISSIYNAVGENEKTITLLYELLGYDHILSKPTWGENQNIYIALTNDIIEILNIDKL